MAQSTLSTLLIKPLKLRATWKSPFTDEQYAHFAKVSGIQTQINDMATARELVQIFYSKEKDSRNHWLRETLNRIASKQGSGHAQKIRSCMTAVRMNEYENDLT